MEPRGGAKGILPAMPGLDLQLVRHALTLARESGCAEVELALGEESFSARLEPLPAPFLPTTPGDEPSVEPEPVPIRAPLVGYYQEAKEPLAVGRKVTKGEVVAVVAALGIANDVESPADGEVAEVLVEPGQGVQFGQPLARVR